MRSKLGLGVVAMSIASVLALGVPASADTTTTSPDSTTTSPTTTTTTTIPGSTTTTVAPSTTDGAANAPASTTSTTVPPTTIAINDGAVIGSGVGRGPAPDRSETQVQVIPIPPRPTTTTTVPTFGLPADSGSGRRAVYSKSQQQVWAVDENGVVIKNHLVSGKLKWCDPRPGTYSVWSRSRYTNSINNPSITWGYMVRFTKGCNGGNIGFHEIPMQYGSRVQSVSQLGTPLSGGCVRQSIPDAIWMWNWAQLGTKVVVLP